MGEVNMWQVATIALGVIAIFLIGTSMFPMDEDIILDGVHMKQSHLDSFSEVMVKGQKAKICNIKQNACTIITKLTD